MTTNLLAKLVEEIRREADISARTGQLERLNAIADKLEAHHAELEATVRDAETRKLEAEQDFLRDWLQFACHPMGMVCCGNGNPNDGCCGDGVPDYADLPAVVQAMNERLNKVDAELAAKHNSAREG